MIALWQLGLGLDATALSSSAQVELAPGARVWVGTARPVAGPLALGSTLEVQGTAYRARTDLYTIDTTFLRASPTFDLDVGDERACFQLGVGPAVAARSVGLRGGGLDVDTLRVEPGARARTAVDVAFGAHGVFRWQVALTTRASQLDYDGGVGLGWRW
ncbi:MAG: hypothetical protein KC656_19810 [Myxococcales bacterium]|nr:hypothetical protein [Myxococcales bacterium]MCA9570106.1 hypothetical protein [Myxococcales bacterium]